jgi:hypothetical protein
MDDTPTGTAQPTAAMASPAAAAAGALPQPTAGGSWARDPVTGALTPLHQLVQASARGLRTHDDADQPTGD